MKMKMETKKMYVVFLQLDYKIEEIEVFKDNENSPFYYIVKKLNNSYSLGGITPCVTSNPKVELIKSEVKNDKYTMWFEYDEYQKAFELGENRLKNWINEYKLRISEYESWLNVHTNRYGTLEKFKTFKESNQY